MMKGVIKTLLHWPLCNLKQNCSSLLLLQLFLLIAKDTYTSVLCSSPRERWEKTKKYYYGRVGVGYAGWVQLLWSFHFYSFSILIKDIFLLHSGGVSFNYLFPFNVITQQRWARRWSMCISIYLLLTYCVSCWLLDGNVCRKKIDCENVW